MRKYFQGVFDLGWFGSAYLLNMEIHELEKKSEQRAWASGGWQQGGQEGR